MEITRLLYSNILLNAETEMEAITLMRGRDEGIFQSFPKDSCLIQGQGRKSESAGCAVLFPNLNLESSRLQGPHINLPC